MPVLPRAAAKFDFHTKEVWSVPLSYRPLTLDASDDEIRRFFARQEEPICGMCPANMQYFEKSIYGEDDVTPGMASSAATSRR